MVVVGCGCGVWVLDSVLVDVFVTGSCGVGCGWLVWVVCLCGLVVAGSVGLVVVFGSRFGLSAFLCGEFDPGSGRTLAAYLTHASRTGSVWLCAGWG